MLSPEEIEKYAEAGRIVTKIRDKTLKGMKVGDRLLDIAEEIEEDIRKAGAKPAFPVNISVNEAAAHYTPQINDEKTVNEGDLVKIDTGVHVEGYIADLAYTYCSEKSALIDASKRALEAGINAIRPGIRVFEISQAIYDEIERVGFGPVVNLTGHSLGRYLFHGGISIPNIPNKNDHALKEGDVVALEPFVCESACRVEDSDPVEIYQFLERRPARSMESRKILDLAEKDFSKLPFAKRWLARHMNPMRIKLSIMELEKINAIRSYPILKGPEGTKIAQSEHTVIVAEKPIVTTR